MGKKKSATDSSSHEIKNVREVLKKEWDKRYHLIGYSLPSENREKYAKKLRLLYDQYNLQKDVIIDLIVGEVNMGSEGSPINVNLVLSLTPGFSLFPRKTPTFEKVIETARKHFKKELKDKEILLLSEEWLIDLFRLYFEINSEYKFEEETSLKEGGLISQLHILQQQLQTLLESPDKTGEKAIRKKIKLIEEAIEEKADEAEDMITRNYANYYEYDILIKISNIVGMRTKFQGILKNTGATKILPAFYVISDIDYEKCMKKIREAFDENFISLDHYMKLQYIRWVNDPVIFAKKEPTKEIEKAYQQLEATLKATLGKEEASVDMFGNAVDSYKDIDKMWTLLSEEDLSAVIELMNAPNLTITKTERKKGFSKSSKRDVHWFSGWSPEITLIEAKKGNPKAYPYLARINKIQVADYYIEQAVSTKECLLLHEVSESLQIDYQGTILTGWDAEYKLSFIEFNNVSGDAFTEKRVIKTFVADQKVSLNEIDEKLDLAQDDLQNEKQVAGIRRRLEGIDKDLKVLEGGSWLNQYDDTSAYVQKTEMERLRSKINNLVKMCDDLSPKVEKITIQKIPDISLDPDQIKLLQNKMEALALYKIRNELASVSLTKPESNSSVIQEFFLKLNTLRHDYPENKEEKSVLINRREKNIPIAKGLFDLQTEWGTMSPMDRLNHEKMTTFVAKLNETFINLLFKLGFKSQK